ncbi:IclR family transcriptional regulator [Bosea sp. AS-1]|jgi:DNA-binding IclR family transcriptional regulator|uniref:IclR family transcriptional regulator n=1 Tax=Bosea sp. AS-1 TaxID=2015316 RepID=UPI000B77D8B4|nr:IclR family transcriptional regulator [Bosea sp. AS-1]
MKDVTQAKQAVGDARKPAPPRSRVSGLDRAVQVLDHLQQAGRASTAYEIARAIGAPLSTIYTIVEDLLDKGLLAKASDGGVWLGPKLYHYGLAYARDLEIVTVATHEMHTLAREVGETVQVCGRDGNMMVVEAMAEGPGHFNVTSRVGTRVPLNWTASGRLLVAGMDRAEQAVLFREGAKTSPTGRAVTDAAELVDQAREALAAGVAIQAGESDFAVACIAAPVLDPDGHCPITISIVLPEFRVTEDRSHFVEAVKAAARRIEDKLGWRARSATVRDFGLIKPRA